MPEARRDPLTGRWVIVAPGRARRPDTVAAAEAPDRGLGERGADREGCPFCPGNERLTPPEIARTGPGAADEPGWRTRVVPNRYPIVGGPGGPGGAGGSGGAGGPASHDPLRRRRRATGAHEVIVLSPDHRRSFAGLDDAQAVEVLTVVRDRARVHAAAGRTFAEVIVNHGSAGGASLAHPHAQIIAGDVEPAAVLGEADRMVSGEGCLVCAELERHRREPGLVIASTDADLWCPWWSGSAYEMLLAARRHRARFEDAEDELPAVGSLLRDGLARLGRALGDPSYNLAIHSRPAAVATDFHWHVHVWPRLQRDGGFERGTGVLVNVVDPEDAAARLREA